jgi:hypothetical protein
MPDVMSVMTRRSAKYRNSAGKERRMGLVVTAVRAILTIFYGACEPLHRDVELQSIYGHTTVESF